MYRPEFIDAFHPASSLGTQGKVVTVIVVVPVTMCSCIKPEARPVGQCVPRYSTTEPATVCSCEEPKERILRPKLRPVGPKPCPVGPEPRPVEPEASRVRLEARTVGPAKRHLEPETRPLG